MKLSDIKGERVFDVIADIIDPIANIAEDNEFKAIFAKVTPPKDVDKKAFAMQIATKRLKKYAPALLRSHKGDVITIMASIEGVSPAEYAESLNLAKLMTDAAELVTDKAFLDLFTSPQPEEDAPASGAALASTVGA